MRWLLKKIFLTLLPFLYLATLFADSAFSDFGNDSMRFLKDIEEIGARPAGTPKEWETSNYLILQLNKMGYKPVKQSFQFFLNADNSGELIKTSNIFCTKKGELETEIIISAHYDSTDDGMGMDDNASGVAVLLETCKRFYSLQTKYTLRFIFFGSEEYGMIGSKYYIEKLPAERLENIHCIINLDGLIAGDKLYVHGSKGNKGAVRDWFLNMAREAKIPLYIQEGHNPKYPKGTMGPFSDFAYFNYKGIQYVDFEGANWDLGGKDGHTQTDTKKGDHGVIWHTKYDTLTYIEKLAPGRIQLRMKWINQLIYAFLTE
jgi:hypothetical protein